MNFTKRRKKSLKLGLNGLHFGAHSVLYFLFLYYHIKIETLLKLSQILFVSNEILLVGNVLLRTNFPSIPNS